MTTVPPNVEDVKAFVIRALHLKDVAPDTIGNDDPFMQKLGLDSVDALELVVAMEKEFGVRIPSGEIDAKTFASFTSLTCFLQARIGSKAGA